MLEERKAGNKLLGILLLTTLLANLPMLSPRFVFVHDTLHKFCCFHYLYSHLFFFDELPKWIPFICYGIPCDWDLWVMHPTDLLCMGAGWCLGVTDALLLFKLAMIVIQLIYVCGFFLLCRRCFHSLLTVFLVCMGAILTNSWFFQYGFILGNVYLLPLVLYFLLRFLESRQPTDLWIAGIVETYSFMGIAYAVPVHVLILIAFMLPFLGRAPSILRVFLSWRTYVHPLFALLVCFQVMVGLFVFGIFQGQAIIDDMRDPATGVMSLAGFLNQKREPIAGLLLLFFRGDVPHSDFALFVGVLPVAALGYALARRRDAGFLAACLVVLVLFWFSLGGWFSTALFYGFPLMNKCRYLSHVLNMSKIFVLLMGGFGIEQILNDLAGLKQSTANDVPRWTLRLMLVLLAAFCVDFVFNRRSNDLTDFKVDPRFTDYSFHDLWYAPWALMARFLLYAGLALALWLWTGKSPAPGQVLRRRAGWLLGSIYLLDLGFFYYLMIAQGPLATEDFGRLLDVQKLTYVPERGWQFSDHAAQVRELLLLKRGHNLHRETYVDWQLLMQADQIINFFPIQSMSADVKAMLLDRGARVDRGRGIDLPPGDLAFERALGLKAKMYLVRQPHFADDQKLAQELFSKLPDPDERPVLTGPGTATSSASAIADPLPRVTFFSANRLVIEVNAGAASWLYYADAFHPSWHATVNGQPAEVLHANIGFKAVAVNSGESEVVFEFKDPARDLLRTSLYSLALLLGGIMLAGMGIMPWFASAVLATPLEMPTTSDPRALRSVRNWAGAVLVASLGCALWEGFGVNIFTVGGLLLTALAVLIRIRSAVVPA